MKIHNTLIGAGLFLSATAAAALSLGPAHGNVILGSLVDLRFEVAPDGRQDVASSCVTARLTAGTTPVPAARVRVTPVPGANHPMVRVQTLDPVVEPILEVTLSAGCQGQVTRAYTFLAQLPSGQAEAGQSVDALATISPRSRRTVPDQDESAAEARTSARAGAPLPRTVRAHDGQVAQKKSRARSAPHAESKAGSAAPPAERDVTREPSARLVMEPLDLSQPPAPAVLQLTRELSAAEPADPARRTEAAAAWRALNQSAEDMQRFDARLDKLEADARTWRAQIAQERTANAELRQRLEQLQAGSYSASVVYVLLGLLLLALAAVWWSLRRGGRAVQAAWQQAVERGARQPMDAGLDTAYAPTQGQASDTLPPEPAANAPTPPLPRMQAAAASVPMPEPAPQMEHPKAQQIVHPEELLDTLQQAEFFISVGEHEQAIAVLRQHIAQHGDTSPVAYLELLRLLHSLGRAQDFAQLGALFQQHFNIRLPSFSRFQEQGRSLFGYPQVLAQIEAQWACEAVVQTLGEQIFHANGPQGARLFDPAAFEDLLLLLSIAQTVPAQQRGKPGPRTRTTPLQAAEGEGAASFDSLAAGLALLPSGQMPLAGDRPIVEAILDVDLTETRPASAGSEESPAPKAPPVGFGTHSDRFEASFELEELDRRKGRGAS